MLKRLPQFAVKFGFWHGAASTFDLLGSSFKPEPLKLSNRTDLQSLTSDWEAIGKDFQVAIVNFRKETTDTEFR
jgi:hypothetical protein